MLHDKLGFTFDLQSQLFEYGEFTLPVSKGRFGLAPDTGIGRYSKTMILSRRRAQIGALSAFNNLTGLSAPL